LDFNLTWFKNWYIHRMDIESLRDYCIHKPGVEECFPFNESVLVFKVGGKMFLLADINEKPLSFNVKCEPEKAIKLRETFNSIRPGFHMNKTHWNTVTYDGQLTKSQLLEQVDYSYDLIFSSLPKKMKTEIKQLINSCS
jgi:predicted DNA-binding protein (MmcQ/YjbR family)